MTQATAEFYRQTEQEHKTKTSLSRKTRIQSWKTSRDGRDFVFVFFGDLYICNSLLER